MQTRGAVGLFAGVTKKDDSSDQDTAFRQDLTDLRPAIWRFALSMSGKADVADDLLQSTCVRALEKSHQFEHGTSLKSWCFTICRTTWLNVLRGQAVRKTGGLASDHIETIADAAPSAETNIFAAEVFNRVMDMPEVIRMTVVLVYVEGFTYREAAEQLNIPIGTVMSRLASARKILAPLNEPEQIARRTDNS